MNPAHRWRLAVPLQYPLGEPGMRTLFANVATVDGYELGRVVVRKLRLIDRAAAVFIPLEG